MALEASRASRAVRELRSLCAEVGQNDPDAFAALLDIVGQLDEMVKDAADVMRNNGYSWADIADAIGTSRQAAQQRFAVKRTATPLAGVRRALARPVPLAR